MMRHAAKAPRPEDVDHVHDELQPIDLDRVPADFETIAPAAEDSHDDVEWPVPNAPRRRGEGVVTLILIAIVGLAVGFAAVMVM